MQTLTPNPDELALPSVSKIKTKKRKSVGKPERTLKKKSKLDEEWQEANIDTEEMMKSSTVDGFMGLEELTDYTEEDLKAMMGIEGEDGKDEETNTDQAASE